MNSINETSLLSFNVVRTPSRWHIYCRTSKQTCTRGDQYNRGQHL